MTWIKTVPPNQAQGRLRALYEQTKGPNGELDNILQAHSLRPHTLSGHLGLYKQVLHHTGNQVDKWFLEALGVLVSALNGCTYCVEHHAEGMARLIGNTSESERIKTDLLNRDFNRWDPKQRTALAYAIELTLHPSDISETLVIGMREQGWDDGEILEINQVVSYFAYANRTVLGLGCQLEGEVLGLSPGSSDEDDWSHQ